MVGSGVQCSSRSVSFPQKAQVRDKHGLHRVRKRSLQRVAACQKLLEDQLWPVSCASRATFQPRSGIGGCPFGGRSFVEGTPAKRKCWDTNRPSRTQKNTRKERCRRVPGPAPLAPQCGPTSASMRRKRGAVLLTRRTTANAPVILQVS